MIRVIDQAGAVVKKDSFRFLERDAVLCQVGSSLAAVPGKVNIAHSIILAILAARVSGPLPHGRGSVLARNRARKRSKAYGAK